jgi:hypothetical protein
MFVRGASPTTALTYSMSSTASRQVSMPTTGTWHFSALSAPICLDTSTVWESLHWSWKSFSALGSYMTPWNSAVAMVVSTCVSAGMP